MLSHFFPHAETDFADVAPITLTKKGARDGMDPEQSRAEKKEREDEQCIGGLRSAKVAMGKISGYPAVGLRIRMVLDHAVRRNWQLIAPVLANLGGRAGLRL